MHYQVLARKWRSKNFDELIGQPHIVRTLKNSLLQKRIAQAYLLAGTRGVGKTSVARIFAKAIRCEALQEDGNPCSKCQSCQSMEDQSSMDIIEIDGASHNGVESIRALIDNVQYLPTSGKYKVYVIDEVHMLSVSAFNALLKTLEEPPEHIIFIFATTDPDKLLKTVLSRCQRLDFRNVQENVLAEHVKKISDAEGIKFENETLITELASLGKGSVRDTLSLLDQLLSMSEEGLITEDIFSLALGVAKVSEVKNLVTAILSGEALEVKNLYDNIFKNNIDLKAFCLQVSHEFFELTQSQEVQTQYAIGKDEAFWIFEAYQKDMAWALEALHPKEVVCLIFQKLALRQEFFLKTEKKKPIIEVKKTEQQQKKFNWKNFVLFVEKHNLAMAQNLKKAVLENESLVEKGEKSLIVSYSEKDEVLFKFISELENTGKVNNLLEDYFPSAGLKVSFKVIKANNKMEKGLVSIEEEEEIKRKKLRQDKEQKLRSNKFILEAQKLFGVEIDKILIKD